MSTPDPNQPPLPLLPPNPTWTPDPSHVAATTLTNLIANNRLWRASADDPRGWQDANLIITNPPSGGCGFIEYTLQANGTWKEVHFCQANCPCAVPTPPPPIGPGDPPMPIGLQLRSLC